MADLEIVPIYGDPDDPDRVTAYADTSSGEIIDLAPDTDRLGFVILSRDDAFAQEKLWEKRRKIFDAILLDPRQGLTETRVTFGDIVASVRSSTYAALNGQMFAEMIFERFRGAFSDDAEAVGRVLAILAAATGYRVESRDALRDGKPFLPKEAEGLYRIAAPAKPTSAWIATERARKRLER